MLLRKLAFTIILITSFRGIGQSNKMVSENMSLAAGRSFNGTGDIDGFGYEMQYTRHFKKWNLSAGFAGSIHDREDLLITTLTYSTGAQTIIDGSIRSTIAGIQLQALGGYSFLNRGRSEALVNLGILFRYQSSSYPDGYETLFPAVTGLNVPVITFDHQSKARSVAVGGIGQLQYRYRFSQKYFAGLRLFLQIDSHSDLLRGSFLCLGRSL